MSMSLVARVARRANICLAVTASALLITTEPAAAIDVDLGAQKVVCVSGAPYLFLDVTITTNATGFGATAMAHMCNAPALLTSVSMQASGLGAAGTTGGPIFFAPYAVKAGNDAYVSGYSAAPSATAQSVIVNVGGAGVGVGSQPTNSCQIVYDRVLGRVVRVDGCNARVTALS